MTQEQGTRFLVVGGRETTEFCRLLQGAGYGVLQAPDAPAARLLADGEALAGVVAARDLVGDDGLALLAEWRGEVEDGYTALLVPALDAGTLAAAQEAEIDDVFCLPVDGRCLVRLRRHLARVRRLQAAAAAETEVWQRFETSQVVNHLLHLALGDDPLETQLQKTLDHILALPWLAFERRGAIFLARGQRLEMVVAHGLGPSLMERCRLLSPGECLCGLAWQQGEVVFADHIDHRHQVSYDGIVPHGHYIVPIRHRDRVLGVINVYTREHQPRTTADEQFLTTVADAVAVMVLRHQAAEERRRMEASLRQGQKMEAIGTLAAGIAHDFNNILTAVLGYAELLKQTPDLPAQVSEDVGQILAAGRRARELVRQILTFSREREGNVQALAMDVLVKEVIKLLRASLPSTIAIRQEVEPDCTVVGDPARLHQLILNLGTNGLQAMAADGGELTVTLRRLASVEPPTGVLGGLAPGDYVHLQVRDTGCGMTAPVLERIFEPYFTTREGTDGTGLGLAVVYAVVRDMGGDIVVSSQPGDGSTFDVYLPAAGGTAAGVVAQEAELPRGRGRILCVDDEEPVVEICRRVLTGLGYTVTTETDPQQALARFQAAPEEIDLLITDQTMPGITGMDLVREVHGLRPDLPVILATGFSELISETALAEAGIAVMLGKPLLRRELARAVHELLGGGNSKEVS